MGSYTIAVLAGDGIGPEVTAEAVRVLAGGRQALRPQAQTARGAGWSGRHRRRRAAISDATMALCQQSDAILFGAIGGAKPGNPDRKGSRIRPSACAKTSSSSPTFAPCIHSPALAAASSLKREVLRGVDLLVVRELTGGLYYGRPSEIRRITRGASAIDTMVYTEAEIERIVRYAFELARARRKRVTSVDKANVLNCSRLWRRVATGVASDYPDVT